MNERDYDELADAAERGELRAIPGTRLTGADAANAGRSALVAATGAATIAEAAELAVGRPRVGSSARESKTWRVRVSIDQDSLVEQAVARTGAVSFSHYVREAVIRQAAEDLALVPGREDQP